MGIYALKNTITGKLYIGGAPSLPNKMEFHMKALCNRNHPNVSLQKSWDEYGFGAFAFSIIEILNDKSKLHDKTNQMINSMGASPIEPIDLMHSYTGFVSLSLDTKQEIYNLGLGTYDNAIQHLLEFYSKQKDEK